MDRFSYTTNAHADYIENLYQSYKADPASVDSGWQRFFEGFDFSLTYANGKTATPVSGAVKQAVPVKELNVANLIEGYRLKGHLKAKTNPIRPRRDWQPRLELSDFGLSDADLSQEFEAGNLLGLGRTTLKKIVERLEAIYAGTIGFEFLYVRDVEALDWLRKRIESWSEYKLDIDRKKRILSKLNEAVVFENFLHTKYIGQKRFSLEGGENTIPALDTIINRGADLGVQEVVIGMAHRGRLNVLANVMGKTYENIFSEFEGTAKPDLTMGDGDVKYHMGFSSQVSTPTGKKVDLKLCPNPSHLEAVNPVVEGFSRAKADHNHDGEYDRVLPILIHGDAAVAGQGIVYEVTQMAGLRGFYTGGTIHFVINNQIGFTTDFDDARTSIYCTDVAKVIHAPVLHCNGDDPEAVVFCSELAIEFRQEFNQDIFIDMVCYRRHGHNESDEPKFTQPSFYNLIGAHANPREVYNDKLIARGDVDAELARTMDKEFRGLLQDRLNMVKQKPLPYVYQKLEEDWRGLRRSKPEDFDKSPDTGISQEIYERVGKALTTVPDGFKPLKQIEKLLRDREEMFFKDQKLNWASAELLAYGSIMYEGKVVRLTGQDVQRGTFSHRHAVLHDAETNQEYNSLNAMGKMPLAIYNSLLSEYAVLGFEFGYAMANPNVLVIWEAQFGDFSNGAQVMIDQFLSSSESKWQRMNGVVCLLPHGYEGQGPEHSNARPERFLQLCAEYNMFVVNITEPSNFFHMLRRQLALPFRKPCIVMSPKSMLRHPLAVSPKSEFLSGRFREVIGDGDTDEKKVSRVLLCSGKLYYELLEQKQKDNRRDVAIIRLEQLHPFPQKQLDAELTRYSKAKLVWVQEEPENMGAWGYVLRLIRHLNPDLVARKPSASPATGYAKVHAQEQLDLIGRAFLATPKAKPVVNSQGVDA